MRLEAVPIDLATAGAFVKAHHRHHPPAKGWKFGIGAMLDGRLVAVACVGRPVARAYDDGQTLEITRLATDGTKNAASFLYGRATKAAVAMGYRRVITYTLAEEPGTTLRAVKAVLLYKTRPHKSWNTPSRPRVDRVPTTAKLCWQLASVGNADDAKRGV